MLYVLDGLLYKQTVGSVKEVIILYIFTKLPLLLTVDPNLRSGRWCPILFPSSGSYLTVIKDVFT